MDLLFEDSCIVIDCPPACHVEVGFVESAIVPPIFVRPVKLLKVYYIACTPYPLPAVNYTAESQDDIAS
jgi:hypothetical protein